MVEDSVTPLAAKSPEEFVGFVAPVLAVLAIRNLAFIPCEAEK